MRHVPVRELDQGLQVVDHHAPFRRVAGDREILQLAAVGRLRDGVRPMIRQKRALGVIARRDRKAQEHRDGGVVGRSGRMPAAVLEVAALAAPSVV
jgi:hypothetical protein